MVIEDRLILRVKELQDALLTLKESLEMEPIQINKDATVKRFEYTFELAWKLMQTVSKARGVEVYSPKSSIRSGAREGLIDDPELWFKFLEARNWTVHIYDIKKADETYDWAKKFVPEVTILLERVSKIEI